MRKPPVMFTAVVAILSLLLMLTGCGATSKNDVSAPRTAEQTKSVRPANPSADAKKVIQTGSLSIDTGNLASTEEQIMSLVSEKNGSTDRINVVQDNNGQRRATYTLRVPQGSLQKLVDSIANLPDCIVRQKTIGSQDVSEEYIDIQARLENMQRQESRLRELLARANTVDEVLKVENEITRVRTQLDAATGKLKALANRIELSTLQLSVREVSGGYWSTYGAKLKHAFYDGIIAAGNVLLGMITVGLGMIPLAGAFWAVRKLWKRRKSAKEQNPPAI